MTPSRAPSPRASRRGGRRAKVVVVSTFPVHPRAFGGQLRAYHVYGSLAPLCDVEIVSLTDPGRAAERIEIAPGLAETLVPRSRKQATLEAECTARSGGFAGDVLSATLTPLYTPGYVDALRAAAEGAASAILSHPYMLPSLREAVPRLPFAYDAHNVEIRLKDALLSPSAGTMRALVREVEGEAVRGATAVFACSPDDRDGLAAEYGVDPSRIAVVPNGVDVEAIPYVDVARRRDGERSWLDAFRAAGGWPDARHLALFLGSDHMPNREAVELLLGLLGDLDGVLLAVAGWVGLPYLENGPSVERAAFLGPFTADTKRVLLSSAAVGLNPVTRGSGTNLKVLEYFAAGVPVVSTPVGARGLDVRDGEELRIVDAEHFGEAITALLAAPDAAADMARRARTLVERRYAWSVVAEPVREWTVTAVAA